MNKFLFCLVHKKAGKKSEKNHQKNKFFGSYKKKFWKKILEKKFGQKIFWGIFFWRKKPFCRSHPFLRSMLSSQDTGGGGGTDRQTDNCDH